MSQNVLNLSESQDGNKIKQGDQSIIRYELSDNNKDSLELNDKNATIYLSNRNNVAYKYDTKVKDDKVELVITDILPTGAYNVEVIVDEKYIFPSDTSARIDITPSVLGRTQQEINQPKITDEYILNVIKNDYAKSVGELDFLWIGVNDSFNELNYVPIIISKNKYKKEIEYRTYEKWSEDMSDMLVTYASNRGLINQKEIYNKAIENNDYFILELLQPEFPIYISVSFPDFEMFDMTDFFTTQNLNGNHFSPQQNWEIKVRLSYNNSPLDSTEISYKYNKDEQE